MITNSNVGHLRGPAGATQGVLAVAAVVGRGFAVSKSRPRSDVDPGRARTAGPTRVPMSSASVSLIPRNAPLAHRVLLVSALLAALAIGSAAPSAAAVAPLYFWSQGFGSTSTDEGRSVAVDGSGNVFVMEMNVRSTLSAGVIRRMNPPGLAVPGPQVDEPVGASAKAGGFGFRI